MIDVALDLRFLRFAVLAAEHGSFRRAAAALNVSQASVSRRIDILEHRLGFALFCRAPTGVTLTRAGRLFLSEAARGINHIDRAMQLAASTNRGERGQIHVGVLASLNSGFVRDVLIQFRKKHGSVDVVLHEATPQESLHSLVVGNLDVSFVTGDQGMSGFNTEVLWSEQVFVAMSATHPLAGRHEVSWADVQRQPFIVTAGGAGPEIHDYLVKRLSGLGFRPEVSVQQVGRESLINLVAIGYGLTLLSSSSLGPQIPGVALLPISGTEDVLASGAIWSAKNSNPALRLLLSVARAMKTVAKVKSLILPLVFSPTILFLGAHAQILDPFR